MQVISAYLVKQIVETDSPSPSGNRFVPKATVIEWLDDVEEGETYIERLANFTRHQSIEITGTPSMGWSAKDVTYEGQTVTGKKEMTLTSLRFRGTNATYFLFPTNDTNYKPFGDWNNSASSCRKWVVIQSGSVSDYLLAGTYTYTTYVDGESVDTGTIETTGSGVPYEDYTSEDASSSPPYAGCEVKELPCFFNIVGFDDFSAGRAYETALVAYATSPTAENKQAVIDALNDSVNP